MPIIIPNEGKEWLLELLLKGTVGGVPQGSFVLRAWDNDYALHRESVLADLVEASYGDYAPISLARASWGDVVLQDGKAACVYGAGFLEFFNSSASPALIYGWYVTDFDNTTILWGENIASAPFSITTLASWIMLPVMRLQSLFDPAPPPPP